MDPTALIGFGSSLVNYGAQQSQADNAYLRNKDLARMQNQYNLDQWNRENAYNSPSAQMARFKQAGLNPNLMYGQQNLSANSPELVGGTPYQSPQANPIDANAIAQLSLLKAQKENIEADTQDKLSGVELNKADIGLKLKQGELTDAEIDQIGVEMDMTKQQIQNLKTTNEQIKADTEYIKQQTAESVQRVENLKSQKGLTDAQIANQLIENANKQEWYTATIRKIQAEAHCSEEQAKLATQQVLLVNANIDLTKTEHAIKYKEWNNWETSFNNNVAMQRWEIYKIASGITKDNVDNLNKLYGSFGGAVAGSQGVNPISPKP